MVWWILGCAVDGTLPTRAEALACEPTTSSPEPVCAATNGFGEPPGCLAHADCPPGPGGEPGFCHGDAYGGCGCVVDECTVDADCPEGTTCVCGDAAGWPTAHCEPSNCATNDDCASGRCQQQRVSGCEPVSPETAVPWGWYCATEADTCDGDEDCAEGACLYHEDRGRFECVNGSAECE